MPQLHLQSTNAEPVPLFQDYSDPTGNLNLYLRRVLFGSDENISGLNGESF